MSRSSTSRCRRSARTSASRRRGCSGWSTPTPWRSAGSCCSAAAPADLIGRREVFAGGLLLFALASLFGGIAQTDGQLVGRAGGAGPGRRGRRARDAVDPHDDLHRGRRAQQGARALGRDGRRRWRDGRAAGRDPDPDAVVALDPADQRADRDHRGARRPARVVTRGRRDVGAPRARSTCRAR